MSIWRALLVGCCLLAGCDSGPFGFESWTSETLPPEQTAANVAAAMAETCAHAGQTVTTEAIDTLGVQYPDPQQFELVQAALDDVFTLAWGEPAYVALPEGLAPDGATPSRLTVARYHCLDQAGAEGLY